MKKLLVLVLLALPLGACASLQKDWAIITGASVSPTQIIVAANAYDAAEATATQYLLFCKAAAPAPSYCALATRQAVVSAVRAGRAARTQLEPYVVSGTAGPAAIYNTLVAVVTQLQTQIPVTGVSK
ncbi:MAG TPA: hypothetical protein VN815_00795 [Steroidobacteraceae bacterium]|nr:hypothetical protein [Steroidobacteraceae bacterium]